LVLITLRPTSTNKIFCILVLDSRILFRLKKYAAEIIEKLLFLNIYKNIELQIFLIFLLLVRAHIFLIWKASLMTEKRWNMRYMISTYFFVCLQDAKPFFDKFSMKSELKKWIFFVSKIEKFDSYFSDFLFEKIFMSMDFVYSAWDETFSRIKMEKID